MDHQTEPAPDSQADLVPDDQPFPVPDYEPDPFPVPADAGGVAATAGDGAAPEIGTAASGAPVTSMTGTAGGVSAAGVTFPHARRPHALSPRKRMAARLAAEAAAAAEMARAAGAVTDGVLTGRRLAVAQAVSESWRTIPHFSVQREIDASDADACLAAMRAVAPEATYTDLLLRAFALAVGPFAWLAGGGGEPGGGASGDVGLAVATPEGVMMPVVPTCPRWPCQICGGQAGSGAARPGRQAGSPGPGQRRGGRGLQPRRTGGGRLHRHRPGRTAAAADDGRIAGRPVVIDGRLAVRTTLIATLNVDHRYFDGDRAADVLDAFDREFRALHTWAGEGDQ